MLLTSSYLYTKVIKKVFWNLVEAFLFFLSQMALVVNANVDHEYTIGNKSDIISQGI